MTDFTAEDTFEALKRVPLDLNLVNESTFEIEGVDMKDYPDFCDAFIGYAEFNDGTVLDDRQMDELNEQCEDVVHEMAFESMLD